MNINFFNRLISEILRGNYSERGTNITFTTFKKKKLFVALVYIC